MRTSNYDRHPDEMDHEWRKTDVPQSLCGAASWVVQDVLEQRVSARQARAITWDPIHNHNAEEVFKEASFGKVLFALLHCDSREREAFTAGLTTILYNTNPAKFIWLWQAHCSSLRRCS